VYAKFIIFTCDALMIEGREVIHMKGILIVNNQNRTEFIKNNEILFRLTILFAGSIFNFMFEVQINIIVEFMYFHKRIYFSSGSSICRGRVHIIICNSYHIYSAFTGFNGFERRRLSFAKRCQHTYTVSVIFNQQVRCTVSHWLL
jgi:hypothetical protein